MTMQQDNGGGTRPGHNGLNPEAIKGFMGRVENLLDNLDTERGEYMQRCKVIREDIALVVAEAKDAGIPKKEFKAVIKTRELENRMERIRDDLEQDQQETFDQIRLALGDLADLPLGGAALAKAGDRPNT